MTTDLDQEMVLLALSERQALWPTTLRADLKKPPLWVSDAEEVVRQVGSVDYFNPHGFTSKVRNGECASMEGNLVWLDLDPPKGMPNSEVSAWIEGRVEEIRALLPRFSIRSSSGRGQWLFWKLAGLISKMEVNRLNRLLNRLGGGGDDTSWPCQGWVRMPGSVNEKTSVTSACIEINAGLHDPDALRLAIDRAAMGAGISLAAPLAGASETAPLKVGSIMPEIDLSQDLRIYIENRPTWDEAQVLGIDRSRLEQSLVARLVNARASDESIKAYFEHHLPAHYCDEVARGRGDYHLRRCIHKAREGVKRFAPSTSVGVSPGDDPYPEERAPRAHVRVRDEDVLRVVSQHQGQPKKVVEAAICKALGCSEATAKRHVNLLAEGGDPYIHYTPINGKSKAVHLTEKGRVARTPTKGGFRRAVQVGFVRANPSRRHETKSRTTTKQTRPRGPAKPVTRETLVKRSITQLRYHQIQGMPRFSWRGQKRTFYVQILDDLERIETTGRKVYDQILLPGDHHVGDLTFHRFCTFISHGWNDEDGKEIPDPLQRIDPEMYWPRGRLLATAVIVEPKGTSFEPATWNILDEHTGEFIAKPAVGWIIEDNFWDTILDDPKAYEDRVFKAVRHGKGATRRFTHTPTEISLDLDHLRDLIDREACLVKWEEHARLQYTADRLPPGWKPWPQSGWQRGMT